MSPAEQLLSALRATLAALEAADVDAAAVATADIATACAALSETAAVLTAAELELARELQGRCEAAADKRQSAVVAELLQSATHQKASHAYGSTT